MMQRFATSVLLARVAVAASVFLLLLPGLCSFAAQPRIEPLVQGVLIPMALLAGYLSICGNRLWIGLLLLIPFVALAPAEAAFNWTYGHPLDHQIIATVFESNLREIRDYLGSAFVPLLLCMLGALFIGALATQWARTQRLVWRSKVRAYVRAVAIALPVAMFIFAFATASGGAVSRTNTAWTQTLAYQNVLEGGYPFGLPLHVSEYVEQWREMRAEATKLATFRFGSTATHRPGQRQIYVLVIGESSARDHWSLFGYARQTTPRLQAIANLVPLSNMVSPWNGSRKAIPVLLTRKPGTDKRDYISEGSIVRAFGEAGFATYWLSNQLAVGQHDSPISVYAYEADTVHFYNFANWIDRGTYDDTLLGGLRRVIAESQRDVFIVLHTMGSHGRYEHRYPPEFDRFLPSLSDSREEETDTRVLNAYDNSILYTDYILASIVQTLQSADAIAAMFYISDHGEDIPNERCKLFGHGNQSRSDFVVPALFWYSERYANAFPSRVAQLGKNAGLAASSENVFESLADLGGLSFPSQDATKSLFSEHYRPHPRIVNSFVQVDIDHGYFTKACKLIVPKEEPGRTDPAP